LKHARLLTPGDWCLVVLLLAAGVFFYLPRKKSVSHETQVLVLSGGKVVQILDPRTDADGWVEGLLGVSNFEIKGARAGMIQSPCPNQTCVRMGKIQRPGDMIVCVPNRVVIRIVGNGDPALDGVTF